jgi:hypothetical protein
MVARRHKESMAIGGPYLWFEMSLLDVSVVLQTIGFATVKRQIKGG